MRATFSKLMCDDSGATAVEYAILVGCLFLTLVIGAGTFGKELTNLWSNNETLIGDGFQNIH